MFRSLSSAAGLERLDLGPERLNLAAIRRTAGLVWGTLVLASHHHEIINPIATGQASSARA